MEKYPKELEKYLNKHEYTIPVSACGKYKFIWAFHQGMGKSMDYYIAELVKRAYEENAPEKAVYYHDTPYGDDAGWVTIDDCCAETQKENYERLGLVYEK